MSMTAEIGAGLSGLEQLRAFMAAGRRPGIGDALDFDLVEVGDGTVVFAGVPGAHAYNPMGMVHGGYFATLLDSACGCAVHSKLTTQQTYTTLELKIAFHKPMTADTGRVRAEGCVVTIGRRVAFAEASLVDANGKLYATATSTLLVMVR
ncbi:MAG TPA: PaaI family thioesterase [Rhodanobacter sp.]